MAELIAPAHANRVELIAQVIRADGSMGEKRHLYWHRNPIKRLIFKWTGRAL